MPLIVDDTAAFFIIRDHTDKNTCVAVGGDGNILRWGLSGKDDQLWLVLPLGDRKYRLMTKTDGKYMAVGSDGNILRWDFAKNQTQEFQLVNEDSDGKTMNIQEPTRDEFVAVGTFGNIVRWSKSNDNDQRFTFEPSNPAAPPAMPVIQAPPGQIGDIPRLTSTDYSTLPEMSEPRVVGASLVPATLVNDPSYSDKTEQMKRNPYYIAVRRQYWSREGDHGYAYEHAKGESATFSKTVIYEVISQHTRTSEETWGWKFSINSEMAVSGSVDGIGIVASNGMAFEISQQLRTTATQSTTVTQRNEETVSRSYDASQPNFTIVGWSLVDLYTLYKGDGTTVVSEVKAGSNSSLRKDAFPSDSYHPTVA